jgi:hypothetical protein
MDSVELEELSTLKDNISIKNSSDSRTSYNYSIISKIFKSDLFAISASCLCCIHCILFPIVSIYTTFSFTSGLFAQNEAIHFIILISVVAFAISALISGFRIHSNKRPLLVGSLSLFTILLAEGMHELTIISEFFPSSLNIILLTIGNVGLILAHLYNFYLIKHSCCS